MLKSQKINNNIFKKRKNSKIFFVLIVFILYFFSSIISGFKNTAAFLSIPSGIIWLFQKFIPTSESLQYLPIIFKTAIETILLAVSSTIVSSIFALFLALIGSEATGINYCFVFQKYSSCCLVFSSSIFIQTKPVYRIFSTVFSNSWIFNKNFH